MISSVVIFIAAFLLSSCVFLTAASVAFFFVDTNDFPDHVIYLLFSLCFWLEFSMM